jgi:Domain of unknown function (DUF4352)
MKKLVIAMCSLSLLAGGALTDAKDAAEQEEHKMGQPFTLGDYTYTITKFQPKRKIGTKYHNKEAEHGGKFLVAYYSIRNNSKETATVLSNDFKVMDDQNRSFSPYSGGSLYLGSDFLLSQLQPGLTKRTATVFEMPDDAFTGPLKLVVPEKAGIFKKKGNAVIELVKAGNVEAQAPVKKVAEKEGPAQPEVKEEAAQPEQVKQEGEKPAPKLSATEVGKKDGMRYGYQLVGEWCVKKNETKKAPKFNPLSSEKMMRDRTAYAAKLGYKTSSEQASYAAAKRHALDETFRKGTGTKLNWD